MYATQPRSAAHAHHIHTASRIGDPPQGRDEDDDHDDHDEDEDDDDSDADEGDEDDEEDPTAMRDPDEPRAHQMVAKHRHIERESDPPLV